MQIKTKVLCYIVAVSNENNQTIGHIHRTYSDYGYKLYGEVDAVFGFQTEQEALEALVKEAKEKGVEDE